MKAIVLAGGLATRLRPLSSFVPKPLVPVLNRPIITHVLTRLRAAGVQEVGVTMGPHCSLVREYLDANYRSGLKVSWLDEPQPLGTGAALRRQLAFFGGLPTLVVTADMLTGVDLRAMIDAYRASPTAAMVAVAEQDTSTWTGDIVVAEEDQGCNYLFKPGPSAPSHLGSCGTWIIHPSVVRELPRDVRLDFSRDVLTRLPTADHNLGVFRASQPYVCDVGDPDRLLTWNLAAARGALDLPMPGSEVAPGVHCEADVGVADDVSVKGPAVIGAGVSLERNSALIGPAVIGPGAWVGPGATVVDALILPGAKVPDGTLVKGLYGSPEAYAAFLRCHHMVPWFDSDADEQPPTCRV